MKPTRRVILWNGPPRVQVEAASRQRFRIVRRGPITRWFQSIGYVRPTLSRDRDFDARFAFEGDDHDFGEALLRQAAARQAIVALMEPRSIAVVHDGRRLSIVARKSRRRLLKDSAEAFGEHLEALDAAAAALPGATQPRPRPPLVRLVIAAVLTGLALLLGGALVLTLLGNEVADTRLGPIVLWATGGALFIALVVLLVLGRMIAGRNASHRELALLLVTTLSGCASAGIALGLLSQRAFDEAPAAIDTERLVVEPLEGPAPSLPDAPPH